MDPPFAIRVLWHQYSHFDSTFHLSLGFHYTLKQYGGWIRPVQLRCHYSTVKCVISLHETFQMWFPVLTNGGGSSPCNTDTIFTVFTISFKSAITLLFRYACPPQEQPLVPRPHCFLTHEDRVLLIFSQIRMPFSAPTGFMAPPLPGVFVAVSCNGTLEQGSPFRIRVHSNYSVVVAIWTFVVWAIYTCPVIGVRCCKAWDIHPVFEKMFFSFQILVLLYELFTSLAFFSHYPGDNQSHEVYLQLSDETIILRLQRLLDLFTPRIHPPWTLLGLCHIRKHGMGILNTRQGEVCMVAPPLLDVHFLIYSIRFPLDHTRCNDFPKLAHSS